MTSTGGGGAGTQEYQNYINAIAEAEAMVGADNMRIFGILVVVLLTLAISGAYVSLRLFYRENEGDHERVVEALNARKNS